MRNNPPLLLPRVHTTMKKTLRCTRLIHLFLALLPTGVVVAAELTAYTEEWAPYNYTEGNAIKGIATDVLNAACAEAKIDCRIVVVPWARAYSTVVNTPNTLIYTIARTAARDSEFVWVGPLLPRTVWVYGRAGLATRVREARHLAQLRIGVVRDDASGPDLLAAGVPASALVEDSSNASVLRMYKRAMVDAVVDTEVGMAWNLRSAAMPANSATRLVKLSDGGAYYFAFNRQSDPQLVRSLQHAFDKVKHDGTFEAIRKKYLEPDD